MSQDWRDWEPGRTGLSVAQLGDGVSVTFEIVGEPFRRDTNESDQALHVPVAVQEAPDGFTDMSGDPVETIDDADDISDVKEYNIINSSSGFFTALTDGFPDADTLTGQVMEVTAHQPGEDAFSRFYSIGPV